MTSGQLDLERKFNELLQERAKLRAEAAAELRSQSETQRGILDLFGETEKATGRTAENQSLLADTLDSVASSTGAATKSMNPFSEALGIVNKSAASLKIGLESLYNFLQPFYSIITLQPIYDWMYEQSAAMGGANTAAFEAAQTLKEAIGTLPKTMEKYTKFADAASKSTAGFGRSLSSIFGYEVGDVTKALAGYVEELGVEFDLFMEQIEGAEGHFIAFNKGLNISVESLTKLTYRFEDTEAAYNDFAKGLIGGSKELGLNIKAVGKNFDAALKNSADFGYMTRKELTATTLYATRLGLEMDELTGMTKKFDTFEGAAESVGKLNTAFGIQLDTMDMVMETNPAKRLDMIRSALEGSGQSLDTIMGDPRKARYLSESLGMTFDQIQKLSKVKTDEFGFTDALDAAEEGTKKMSDNDAMNEMVKQIRELNRTMGGGSQVYQGFFSAFIKGFKEGLERTAAFRKMFGTMQSAFASFYDVGVRVVNLVAALFYDPLSAVTDQETGRITSSDGAPLFKYFFKPFLDYFMDMRDAANALMVKGGPLDKVFDFINAFLRGDAVDKNFSIIGTLFEPFESISKPNLLTPQVMEGVKRVAELVADALGDAFRFIGDRAIAWVDGLFKPASKVNFEKQKTFLETMANIGNSLLNGLSDMFSKLGKAGKGLLAYVFGGTYGGKTIPYEESLFGSVFGNSKQRLQDTFAGTGFTEQIVSGIVTALANIFGSEKLAEIFDAEGVGLGKKFEYMFAKVKYRFFQAVTQFILDVKEFGVQGMKDLDKDPSMFNLHQLSPTYKFMEYLAGADDSSAMTAVRGARKRALADMRGLEEEIKEADKTFKNMVKQSTAAGLGDDLNKSLEEMKKRFTDGYTITDGDVQESLEITTANFPRILQDLEDIGASASIETSAQSEEIAKALSDGYLTGLENSAPLTEEATKALMQGNLQEAKDILGIESPSVEYMIIGQYMADGLMAGFFGDDQLIPGSAVNGFKVRFAQEMTKLSDEIDDHYNDLGNSAIVAIETKLGKIGRILRAEQPMRVEVNTNKLQVNASFKITLDSAQLGAVMASDPKGSFFALNERRFGGAAAGTTNKVSYRTAYRNFRNR